MKNRSYILLLLLLGLLGWHCAEFEYNNPLDPEGINKSIFEQDPDGLDPTGWKGDDNHDGIINLLDPTYNQDTSAPVITFLVDNPVTIDNGNQEQLNFILTQWEATDNEPFEKNEPTGTVNLYKDSCYTMQFSATDSLGNTGYGMLEICVVTPPKKDTTPPILTISDSIIEVILNEHYTPPTYSAFDNMDKNITDSVKTDKEVDTTTPGEQIITYSVSDKAGNTTSKTVKVIIKSPGPPIDIMPPKITLLGEDTIFLSEDDDFEAFKASYQDAGATAEDNVDPHVNDKIVVSDFIEINKKYYYISYNVTDSSGNRAEEVRRYFDTGIKPPSPPIIELDQNDSCIVRPGGIFVEPGYTATDVVDHDITNKVVVDTSQLLDSINIEGVYKVFYFVENSSGMTHEVYRLVYVKDDGIDTDPPIITLKGRNPDTVLYKSSTAYVDPGATAIDSVDGDLTDEITVTINVNMNSFGKYSVNYRVKDKAGWTANVNRTVYVVRDTSTNDLLLAYGVPTEDPLPAMANLSFTNVDIDGEGPETVIETITKLKINWQYEQGKGILREVAFEYVGPPNYKAVTSYVTQSFEDAYPVMTISHTEVTGLDGEYYVTYDGSEFVWVETSGKYAIIWTK